MYYVVFCMLLLVHHTFLGAVPDADPTLSLWWQAGLCQAIQVVALPDVLTAPHTTKTNVDWDKDARSLEITTAVVVHPNTIIAEIFARHIASADSFLKSPWRKQAHQEIKTLLEAHNMQELYDDAIRTILLASISLSRTPEHAWPRYRIYTKSLTGLTYGAITKDDEQPTTDLFCITGKGACRLQGIKALIAKGEFAKAEAGWLNTLFVNQTLGIKITYGILNQGYNELFPTQPAEPAQE